MCIFYKNKIINKIQKMYNNKRKKLKILKNNKKYKIQNLILNVYKLGIQLLNRTINISIIFLIQERNKRGLFLNM